MLKIQEDRATATCPRPTETSSSRRVPALDGFRVLIVALVVLGHYFNPSWLAGTGTPRVVMFFTLTGFLITSILFSSAVKVGSFYGKFTNFLSKRAARLLPAVGILVVLLIVLNAAARVLNLKFSVLSLDALWEWIPAMVSQGVSIKASHSSFIPFEIIPLWSLNMDWMFYLLWPPIFFVAYKLGGRKTVFITALLLTSASFLWSAYLWVADTETNRVMYGFDARAGAFLIGCLLAAAAPKLVRFISSNAAAVAAGCGSVAVLFIMQTKVFFDFSAGMLSWGQIVVSLATALLILVIYHKGSEKIFLPLSIPVMLWLAQRAYGFFIFHTPFLMAFGGSETETWLKVAALAVTLLFVTVIYRFVESPINTFFLKQLSTKHNTGNAATVDTASLAPRQHTAV